MAPVAGWRGLNAAVLRASRLSNVGKGATPRPAQPLCVAHAQPTLPGQPTRTGEARRALLPHTVWAVRGTGTQAPSRQPAALPVCCMSAPCSALPASPAGLERQVSRMKCDTAGGPGGAPLLQPCTDGAAALAAHRSPQQGRRLPAQPLRWGALLLLPVQPPTQGGLHRREADDHTTQRVRRAGGSALRKSNPPQDVKRALVHRPAPSAAAVRGCPAPPALPARLGWRGRSSRPAHSVRARGAPVTHCSARC